jgi:hypothetical protein
MLAGTRAADDLCRLLASQLQRLAAVRLGQKLVKQYVRIAMLKLGDLSGSLLQRDNIEKLGTLSRYRHLADIAVGSMENVRFVRRQRVDFDAGVIVTVKWQAVL